MKPGQRLPVGLEQTWLLLEPTWENPPSISAPCLSHHGVPRAFSEVPMPSASDLPECSSPAGTGGSCGTHRAAAPADCGVLQRGLHLEPVCGRRRAAPQGSEDTWLSQLCPSHMMRHFTPHGATPFGEQVLFHSPQLLHH